MKEENINKGVKLYDDFVGKIYPFGTVATPTTKSLELFGFLSHKNQGQLVSEMCREFISNFEEDFFIENNELKQQVTIPISITDGVITKI